jgi:hypothetical protein
MAGPPEASVAQVSNRFWFSVGQLPHHHLTTRHGSGSSAASSSAREIETGIEIG